MASQVLLEQVLISGPFILLYFYSFMSQCNTHTREYASQAQTTEQMITTNRKTYFHICHHKFSNCMHCTAHTLRHTCAQREALAAKGACRTHRNAYYDIPKMLKQTAHHWESDKKNWKLIGFEKKRQSADEETNKLNLGRTTKRSRPKRYSFLRCTSRIFFFIRYFPKINILFSLETDTNVLNSRRPLLLVSTFISRILFCRAVCPVFRSRSQTLFTFLPLLHKQQT